MNTASVNYYNGGNNYPRREVMPENLGFVHKKDSSQQSVLKIETNPRAIFKTTAQALIHKVCKCCFRFTSVTANCGSAASSSFNVNYFGGERSKVDSEEKQKGNQEDSTSAVIISGSGNNFGRGGDHGGGDNSGSGGGGLNESAGWEGVKWWCWWFFEMWRNHWQLEHPNSSAMIVFSRMVPILVGTMMLEGELDPSLILLLEAFLMPLLGTILLPLLLVSLAFAGLTVAMQQIMLLFAVVALACVLTLLFLFWELNQAAP